MAAAWSLSQQANVHITVVEAAHRLGGRARSAPAPAEFSAELDNGQHLLLGAYRETLRIIQSLHPDIDSVLLRLPLQLQTLAGDRNLKVNPQWPAPLHSLAALLTAQGWSWSERFALIRALIGLRLRRFRFKETITVKQWLESSHQPQSLIDAFWSPLCIAALNTSIEQACAGLFAATLRDGLLGTQADSDMILPRVDLSALWVEPLAARLESKGHRVQRGHAVRSLAIQESRVMVDGDSYDAAILALAPWSLGRLALPDADQAAWFRAIAGRFEPLPIATLYLSFADRVPALGAMQQLRDWGAGAGPGQWMFAREHILAGSGQNSVTLSSSLQGRQNSGALSRSEQEGQNSATLGGSKQGTELAVVISHPQNLPDLDTLERQVLAQLRDQGLATLPAPIARRLIIEKRATFAATPGLLRPGHQTPWPRVMLAGDYTDTGYPSVLEGAVRSGLLAAQALKDHFCT